MGNVLNSSISASRFERQVTEDYTFDPQTGLLTNQKATKNGSQTLIDLSYDYTRNNAVGTLTGKTGHLTKITDNLNTQKNREYEFDVLGRLTKAKGGVGGALWDQTYTYDRWGNRTNVANNGTAAGGGTMPLDGIPNLAYENASNRISTSGYQYDVAGNQTKTLAEDGSTWVRYEYDSANRLWLVKRDSDGVMLQRFGYGATNARFQSLDAVANIWTLYAATGGNVLAEYIENSPNTPTWVKTYTYFGGSQLSTITPNGSNELIEYNHPDRLGTKLITNQTGGTSYEQAHLPFGRPLDAESSGSTAQRFTTYERSAITKLDYAINRTYDSKLGRFTQVDPIGIQAASLVAPQTLNMYNYCGNDPINYSDPSGLFFGKLFKWLMKAIKWIAIAVTVAFIVVSAIWAPGSTGFIAKLMLGLLDFLSKIGSVMSFASGGLLAATEGIAAWQIGLLGVMAAGSGAAYAQKKLAKPKKLPCPPNMEDLIQGKGWKPPGWFASTINRALELANKNSTERPDSGRYKEVGGWILLSPNGQNAKTVTKTPESEPADTGTQVQLGEPRKHVEKLLKKGWLIVGDFHTHSTKISNPADVSISNARKTPGVWIYPDGSTEVYGPKSGILGVGIPKHCSRSSR